MASPALRSKQLRAAELVATGLTYAESGELVGRSERTLTRWLHDPALRAISAGETPTRGEVGPVETLRGALQATKASGQPDWPTRVAAVKALAALRPDEVEQVEPEQPTPSIVVYDLPPGAGPVVHRAPSGGENTGERRHAAGQTASGFPWLHVFLRAARREARHHRQLDPASSRPVSNRLRENHDQRRPRRGRALAGGARRRPLPNRHQERGLSAASPAPSTQPRAKTRRSDQFATGRRDAPYWMFPRACTDKYREVSLFVGTTTAGQRWLPLLRGDARPAVSGRGALGHSICGKPMKRTSVVVDSPARTCTVRRVPPWVFRCASGAMR
jgi:hypothetical protein